ncbi:MAG: LamG-like jellyroll fold domain-containing protein [Verrucomicrobiales bacterium]
MNGHFLLCCSFSFAVSLTAFAPSRLTAEEGWQESLAFLASFDGPTADADQAIGDGKIYTLVQDGEAPSKAGLHADGSTVLIPDQGLGGSGAMQFKKRDAPWLFYKAEDNVAYSDKDWSGTVSVWLRLDSADLDPGFCDPIQLTTRAWNDGAMFVDFDKEGAPRDFRLGVYPDLAVWNPDKKEVPDEERPLLKVSKPPFSRDQWTHVAFTWQKFNSGDKSGVATFYLNGKRQGSIEGWNQTFTWKADEEKRLYIGLNYQGLLDDLACFNRALSDDEIASVYANKDGLKPLVSKPKPIRIGMIGLDTSHVIAFTKIINDPHATGELSNVQVVAAFPGGSDLPDSVAHVDEYTRQLREEMGIEMVDSIPALLQKVDVVMLESVDGRPHLEEARPVIEAGKPLFIDKPVAGSLADAVAIFALAKENGVPCFSSSALRFSPDVAGLRGRDDIGEVLGCVAWSPCTIHDTMPDLFYYGIHGVESLFTIMGPGCVSVSRTHSEGADVVTGIWNDGRIGTFRGLRAGRTAFGATVFGSKGIAHGGTFAGYEPLVSEVAKFFRTGEVPVTAAQTLEIFAFMQAAEESKRMGGAPVNLADVMPEAR